MAMKKLRRPRTPSQDFPTESPEQQWCNSRWRGILAVSRASCGGRGSRRPGGGRVHDDEVGATADSPDGPDPAGRRSARAGVEWHPAARAAARHRDREPEGRGRQDHDGGEPRCRARGRGLSCADRRPRPAGQRDDRRRPQPTRRDRLDLPRDHGRRPRWRTASSRRRSRTSSSRRRPSTSPVPRSSSCRRSAVS